jgi:demethylmenaquinone methyltransferase/2-methoxy-6-polyprenyl-1,4-benzoquinol methylase
MTGDASVPWAARVAPVERSTAEARVTYDRLARWYDLVEAPFERQARAAGVRLLEAQPGERILEIGFGTGHTLLALARGVAPGGVVLGVDLSQQMAHVARHRLARNHPPLTPLLAQADARQLPLRERAVDAVTMSFTLELMATVDIPVLLGECERVLRPGGRLVVVSLDLHEPLTRMTRVYLAAHRRWPRLVDCRPLPLRDVLISSGLEVLHAWRSTVVGLPVAAVLARRA